MSFTFRLSLPRLHWSKINQRTETDFRTALRISGRMRSSCVIIAGVFFWAIFWYSDNETAAFCGKIGNDATGGILAVTVNDRVVVDEPAKAKELKLQRIAPTTINPDSVFIFPPLVMGYPKEGETCYVTGLALSRQPDNHTPFARG